MRRLAGPNRILYAESLTPDAPCGMQVVPSRRVRGRRSAPVEPLCEEVPGLHRLQPQWPAYVLAGGFGYPRPVRAFDLAVACDVLELRPNLLWLADPAGRTLRDWLGGIPIVYQVDDALARRPYLRDRTGLKCVEDALLDEAEVVLCGSRPIFLRLLRRCGDRVHYLPPRIETARFAGPAAAAPALVDIPRPIAGFCGAFTIGHDVRLLEQAARSSPDVSFVLPRSGLPQVRRLSTLNNVYLVEGEDPARWPQLLPGFDVCLLPLRPTSWLAEAFPPQLLPYLASGRPVVSTRLPQVEWLAGSLVSIADRGETLADAIRWELAHDSPQRVRDRLAIVAEHDCRCRDDELALALGAVNRHPGVDTLRSYQNWLPVLLKNQAARLGPEDTLDFLDQLGRLGLVDTVCAWGADVVEEGGE